MDYSKHNVMVQRKVWVVIIAVIFANCIHQAASFEKCDLLGNKGHRTLVCDVANKSPVMCDPCFEECYQVIPATQFTSAQWGCRCVNNDTLLLNSTCSATTPYCQISTNRERICSATKCSSDSDCDDSCRKMCNTTTGHCVTREPTVACPDTEGSTELRFIMPSSCSTGECFIGSIMFRNYTLGAEITLTSKDVYGIDKFILGKFRTRHTAFQNEQPLSIAYYTGDMQEIPYETNVCGGASISACCGFSTCPTNSDFTNSNANCYNLFTDIQKSLGSFYAKLDTTQGCTPLMNFPTTACGYDYGCSLLIQGLTPYRSAFFQAVYVPISQNNLLYTFTTENTGKLTTNNIIQMKSARVTARMTSSNNQFVCDESTVDSFCFTNVNVADEYNQPLGREAPFFKDYIILTYLVNTTTFSTTLSSAKSFPSIYFSPLGNPTIFTVGSAQTQTKEEWIKTYPTKRWSGIGWWSTSPYTPDSFDYYSQFGDTSYPQHALEFPKVFPQIRGRCDNTTCVNVRDWNFDMVTGLSRLITTNMTGSLDISAVMIERNLIVLNITIQNFPDYDNAAFAPNILDGSNQLSSPGFIASVTVGSVVIAALLGVGIWLAVRYFYQRKKKYTVV